MSAFLLLGSLHLRMTLFRFNAGLISAKEKNEKEHGVVGEGGFAGD